MKVELFNVNEKKEFFNFAVETIFEEWGDGNIEHLNHKKEKLQNDTSQRCYVLVINDMSVGCFVICENDIKGYPEYNPNLACVCIAKQYRGLGYSKILLNKANETFRNLNIKKAYLKTDIFNFYEKFGWIYIKDIIVKNHIERLYLQDFE